MTDILDVKKNREHAILRPCYVVFDIVLLNGMSMLNLDLEKRYKDYLVKCIQPKDRVIEILPNRVGENVADVISYLDEIMREQLEGIVIKSPTSTYQVAKRGNDWLKLKADYIDCIGESLDVLVVGGAYGTASRMGKLSSFTVAVLDDREETTHKKWLTLGKVGGGFSDSDYSEIDKKCHGKWKPFNINNMPEWLDHSRRGKRPDMLIEPKDSFVVSIKFYELVPRYLYHILLF